jgi:hypothetical protein
VLVMSTVPTMLGWGQEPVPPPKKTRVAQPKR